MSSNNFYGVDTIPTEAWGHLHDGASLLYREDYAVFATQENQQHRNSVNTDQGHINLVQVGRLLLAVAFTGLTLYSSREPSNRPRQPTSGMHLHRHFLPCTWRVRGHISHASIFIPPKVMWK
ncbi:hypothetical protein PAXRUDRAFT_240714 [Paxillus rubicundulus Ve08.2h10]|uniref:Uncharacterized protein n=1 Tax=Paxillus rubicundulus Ve08.2h10 TaxID=930991 RepID=A0A0D0D978_9AGAM|nr:hypothetical protein PAXRUDRAFT_240714 [Paxillus rubicundulus Ve08.2h10]